MMVDLVDRVATSLAVEDEGINWMPVRQLYESAPDTRRVQQLSYNDESEYGLQHHATHAVCTPYSQRVERLWELSMRAATDDTAKMIRRR